MDLYCTRPGCPKPVNSFADLDDAATLKTVQQKYCTTCGMPLILLGRYLPQRLLGQGGFGAAFLACDRCTPSKRPCVVKQFQPSGHLSPAQLQVAQQLFEREGEALEQLGNPHPQIPDLYAIFELSVPSRHGQPDDKLFYLAQEFIDGQTMEDEVEQQGALSSSVVQEVLEAVLKILEFVHGQGAIHRDIKPSNIMRHRNGLIYLLDFGAVRQATHAGTPNRSTGIYSLGYAPPEQVAGSQVYPATDLYALAVTCITLLTAKPPHELFDSYSNTWKWHADAPHVSRPLRIVLDRMLLATPSERFQSATETLAALKQRSGLRSGTGLFQRSAQSHPPGSSTVASRPAAATTAAAVTQPPAAPPLGQPPAVTPLSRRSAIAPFAPAEFLAGAAFTGFEAGLLAISLFSLPLPPVISAGLWLLTSIGLVILQSRRILERWDLLILAVGSLTLVLVFPFLRQSVAFLDQNVSTIVVLALFLGLLAMAVAALFRLIHRLLSRIL